MNFLLWHYQSANKFILKVWGNYLLACWHFFSLSDLLKNLFAPWRRVSLSSAGPGFDLGKAFEQITFNLLSRFIGFLVRIILITWGFLSLLFFLIFGLAVIVCWQLLLPVSWILYLWQKNKDKNRAASILQQTNKPEEIFKILQRTKQGEFIFNRLGIRNQEIADFIDKVLTQTNWLGQDKVSGSRNLTEIFYNLSLFWQPLTEFLNVRGIKPIDIFQVAFWFEQIEKAKRQKSRFWEKENLLIGPGLGANFAFGYTPNLDEYVTDLTQPQAFFHQLVARKEEVGKIEEILSRSNQNNVLLLGEPGVGKHTIVLGFARLVFLGKISHNLAHKRVLQLDMDRIIQKMDLSSVKSKLTSLLKEAYSAGNVILVIDNIDKYVSAKEGVNLTDVFAKVIASQRLQLIAITTQERYNLHIAANQEFSKLFEKVQVEPVNSQTALQILETILPDLEENQVLVTFQALKEIVTLSEKLITDIPFPEKAIDLLDQIISRAKNRKNKVILKNDIDQLVSVKTKVPVGALDTGEKEKLVDLEKNLKSRVIGQDKALVLLVSALKRARTGIASTNKPIGSFLFLGPTGVGKTETAKALAQFYFGSEKQMIRLDMSQYQEQSSLENLIGSENSGNGPLVTQVKDKPFGVLLLDELEKAHPRILNIFLTILDEGYLTDIYGKKVSFTNLVIIATSNAGAEFIREKVRGGAGDDLAGQVVEYIQQQGIFSPEFLNRFDALVVFKPLEKSQLQEISRLLLQDLAERLQKQDLHLEITPDLIDNVAGSGYSQEFGCRPMKRFIADKIEDEIAKAMLSGKIGRGVKMRLIWDSVSKKYELSYL